jgi:Amt family ammonium transporter
MAGKMIGVLIVLGLITIFVPRIAHASSPADDPTPEINAINTVWVLIAAFLVFCMQVGFEMLEAGFARSREAVNILAEGIADTCICGITFWAWGFAFMFMAGTPFIGTSGFFSAGFTGNLWLYRYTFAGVLGISICLCRYLFHDHIRGNDWTHGLPR